MRGNRGILEKVMSILRRSRGDIIDYIWRKPKSVLRKDWGVIVVKVDLV